MDLSWQHGLNDYYMPYKIQSQRSLVEKVRGFQMLAIALVLKSAFVGGGFGEGGQGAS